MFFSWYAKQVLARPKLCLVLAFLLAVTFAFLARDVRLNNHFAELFAIDNDANHYREFYRQQFGADDGLLIAIVSPEEFSDDFFTRLSHAHDELEQHPNMQRVLSAVNSSVIRQEMVDGESQLMLDPLFGVGNDYSFEKKVKMLRESTINANRFIAKDHDSVLVIAELPASFDRFKKIEQPAKDFQAIIEGAFENNVSINYAGIAFTRIAILGMMLQDLLMLVPLTSLIVAFFTFVLFRSFSLIFISFCTTMFGLLGVMGLMGIFNDDINQLTMTFPVLLMVIVVANGIHFFHRYFQELETHELSGDKDSLRQAVAVGAEKVAKAAFLSCLTTAIGFYALVTADMEILQSFGFYLGSGVLISYLGLILIIPPTLLLLKPSYRKVYQFEAFSFIDKGVKKMINSQLRFWIIAAGFGFLIWGAVLGSKASYDYELSDMLDEDHPRVLAGLTLDEQFAGALPLEISLLGKPDDFLQADVLKRIDSFHTWLEDEGIDASALSIVTVLKALNKGITGLDELPESDAGIAQLLLLAEGSSDDIIGQLATDDFSHVRIKANTPDVGAEKVVAFKARLNAFAEQAFSGTGIRVEMTGEIPVAYEGMNKLTEELLKSVLTALLFIIVTILLVFRDWTLALGSIFPNILPIVLGLAFYTLSGHGLNPLPGIAFCIAIGIAVDDTVHLFSRFNEELELGKSRNDAVIEAVKSVKGALLSSSLILTLGFLVFLFSQFTWNRELGLLGAYLIVLALLSDLIFTPAVLSIKKALIRKKPKTESNAKEELHG